MCNKNEHTEHRIKTLLPGLHADEEILQMIGFPGPPPRWPDMVCSNVPAPTLDPELQPAYG